MDRSLRDSSSMEFSRQECWSGLPFLSPGIFLTQGLNPGLLHCKQRLYHLSHQGHPTQKSVSTKKTVNMVREIRVQYSYQLHKCLRTKMIRHEGAEGQAGGSITSISRLKCSKRPPYLNIWSGDEKGLLRSFVVWWRFSHQVVSDSCNPMDYSPPGSPVHGISQARMLEWVAIPFCRGSSWPRYQIQVFCIAGRFFTNWAQSFTNPLFENKCK